MDCLRWFQIPGQDLVWRHVLPDHPSALQGPQSTQAKGSSSAMRHAGRRRNANEFCGAYGHGTTREEMLWLSRWCLVRGVNLLVPHAFYYSVRRPRGDERPPDVGPHSPWWDRYREHADEVRRLCWLNTDAEHVCGLAVLAPSDRLPWRAAEVCYRNQRDFNYLSGRDLRDRAVVRSGRPPRRRHALPRPDRRGGAGSRPDGDRCPPWPTPAASCATRRAWRKPASWNASTAWCLPDVRLGPAAPSVRVHHVVKDGVHAYLLFNEEKAPVETVATFSVPGERRVFDPRTATMDRLEPGRPLRLEGHQLLVILIGQGRMTAPGAPQVPKTSSDQRIPAACRPTG